MKKSRLIALFTSVMLIISTLFMSVPAFASTTTGTQTATRLGGANRYEVAANIATTYFKTASTVILVNGADEKLADGLAATPLAKAYNAPILLTAANSIPTETQAALDTIKPSSYIIIGGPASVSDSIKTSLGATRIGGADRYEVATNVAEALKAKLGVTSFSNAVITNGAKFADALAAAPFAAKASEPVLFVTANTNDSATKATIGELGTLGITTTDAIGGSASIPDSVVTAVKGTRVNGATREDLSVAIASKYASNPAGVYAVNGYKPADALAIGPLAATTGYPILYVNSDVKTVKAAVTDYVTATTTIKPENVVAVGGTGSVADVQRNAVVTAATPVALAVSSANAINATQLKIVFTQPVDGTATDANAATNLDNYYVNNVKLSSPAAKAVLQSDGKTVIITLATALTNGATNVYTVEPIASSTDSSVKSPIYTTTETYTDSTAPTVTSVTSSTNSNYATSLTINYSEPVSSGSLKIDGSYIAGANGSSQTITGVNLDATKTHTLEYINLTDYASTANVTADATITFSITKDTTAPVVTSVVPYGEKQILVTFNKAMGSSATTAANYSTVDETLTPYPVSSVAALSGDTTGTKYVLSIASGSTIYSSTTSHVITVAFSSSLLDSLGNALTATTKTVTITKDSAAPFVTDIVAEKDATGKTTDLLVKYNEGLAANSTGVNSSLLTIVDTNGVLISTSGLKPTSEPINTGDTSVKFGFTTPSVMNVKWNITVPSSLVTDNTESLNASTGFSKLVDMSQTAPTTFTVSNATSDGKVVTVTFANAVKGGAVTGSATDPSKYSINGTVLPAGTSITFTDSTQKVATITLPSGFITKTDPNAVIRISNIQDLNGLVVTPYVTTLNVIDNTAPTLTGALDNSDKTVSLSFSETVLGLTSDDLHVKVAGADVSTSNYSVAAGTGADTGKWVLTFNTGSVPTLGQQIIITTTGTTGADAAGNKVVANGTATVYGN